MSNQDTDSAWAYHEATKLSYINLSNKPPIFKSYTGLPVVPLPTDFPSPPFPALDAVAAVDLEGGPSLDVTTLAQLLFSSAGLIRKSISPVTGEVHYRAAASAGALYPVEVYLICRDLPGLEAGVYHFSPRDFTLRQLRKGDYRGELSNAAGDDESISTAPATLICTAIFWRGAWKYRARSYRYCFWDSGTILANLLATASAAGLPARVIAGFIDGQVNQLVGVHPEREASLCLIPLGKAEGSTPAPFSPELGPVSAEEVSISEVESDYPEIRQMHATSSLYSKEEVTAWRGVWRSKPSQQHGPCYPLNPLEGNIGAKAGLGAVILGRGSTRRFSNSPISFPQLSSILNRATRGVPCDFLGKDGASLLDTYIIVNAVEGLPSGSYFFSAQRDTLEMLREGTFRPEAGHLCFEQALGADASSVLFFMADLEAILGCYGNRGYRAAQLEAGILGGKIYLCAHSLGLGASGLTFYDDEIASFFSPHARGKSAMFVVALGITDRRNRVRPFRSQVGVKLDALARGAARKKGDNC